MPDKRPAVSPEVVGARVQRYRLQRQLTQEELAKGSGISLTTLQKLEAGKAVRHRTLEKIMEFVREFEWDFTMPIADWDRPYRVYAPKDEAWLVAFNTKDSPGLYPDGAPVFDEQERKRLGRLGFVSSFNLRFSCDLREGRIRAALVELYSDFQKGPFKHPEEEFVYCLRGNIRVTVGKDEIDLAPGQAMTFWSTEPHTYGLASPLKKEDEPALFLMVWTVGKAIRAEDTPTPKRRPRTPKALKNQPSLIKR